MAIQLYLQSSSEALSDLAGQLQAARTLLEQWEEQEVPCRLPSGELDRMLSQCQAWQRKLDQWRSQL